MGRGLTVPTGGHDDTPVPTRGESLRVNKPDGIAQRVSDLEQLVQGITGDLNGENEQLRAFPARTLSTVQ
jgi:hypothetical protein